MVIIFYLSKYIFVFFSYLGNWNNWDILSEVILSYNLGKFFIFWDNKGLWISFQIRSDMRNSSVFLDKIGKIGKLGKVILPDTLRLTIGNIGCLG